MIFIVLEEGDNQMPTKAQRANESVAREAKRARRRRIAAAKQSLRELRIELALLNHRIGSKIEIKDIDLNETMVRAIAKQAEAERLRRAKVINAMGEQQAAEKLVEAGKILAQEPQAMQLRYFAALHDIAGERSSTVVFPLPMNLLDHLTGRGGAT